MLQLQDAGRVSRARQRPGGGRLTWIVRRSGSMLVSVSGPNRIDIIQRGVTISGVIGELARVAVAEERVADAVGTQNTTGFLDPADNFSGADSTIPATSTCKQVPAWALSGLLTGASTLAS